MHLREIALDIDYRSNHGRLVDMFYIPCLRASTVYLRAVGYFTSYSLAVAAAGLAEFVDGNGSVQLVASPELDEADLNALKAGYEARDDIIQRALLARFRDPLPGSIEHDRLGFLAWLIAEGRLDIRLAVRAREHHGIYHEKFGVFIDQLGDSVAFVGSPNETVGGLAENFESIDVFRSWTPGEAERVERKLDAFSQLWADETHGVDVFTLPEAIQAKLISYRPARRPKRDPLSLPEPEAGDSKHKVGESEPLRLRSYQEQAIEAWERNDRVGILEMATGTGKTITALVAASRALPAEGPNFLLVVVPYVHLVHQWAREMAMFGLSPILGFGSTADWGAKLRAELELLRVRAIPTVTCVATHAALGSAPLRGVGKIAFARRLIVADEVHHLGAPEAAAQLESLPFSMRLGLSATPRRWLDPDGDGRVINYFGDVVFSFGLKEAIEGGYLVPYDYHPILTELVEEENDQYREVAMAILDARTQDRSDGRFERLVRRRSEILNSSRGKTAALAELFPPGRKVSHTLVYTNPRRLEETTSLLAQYSGIRTHRFTFREDSDDRMRLLAQFDAGYLDALVAIRCLDEGVDIPSIRGAVIVASSGNPRQFIQRRGRILRKSPGKAQAAIWDMISVPAMGTFDPWTPAWEHERSLVRRELMRVAEFASLAGNAAEARARILPIQERYQLLDV